MAACFLLFTIIIGSESRNLTLFCKIISFFYSIRNFFTIILFSYKVFKKKADVDIFISLPDEKTHALHSW